VAVYGVDQWTLTVESTPVAGVPIDGDPDICDQATNYAVEIDDNCAVSLTAPESCFDGRASYEFVRWVVGGVDRPAHQPTVTFRVNGDLTALAVYTDGTVTGVRTHDPVYLSDSEFSVTIHIEYADVLTSLGVSELLPDTWVYVSASGPGVPPIQPAAGATGRINFAWITPPASPVEFTYVVHVPPESSGAKWFRDGMIYYRRLAGEMQALIADTSVQHAYLLGVESRPVVGVPIGGTAPGATPYAAKPEAGSSVTLVAPASHRVGEVDYSFARWEDGAGSTVSDTLVYQFVMDEDKTARAVYEVDKRTLTVTSTPLAGVPISGFPADTTVYSVVLDDNTAVSLTAPETFVGGGTDCVFVRWRRNSFDQPAGVRTLDFDIGEDTTAEAVYEIVHRSLTVRATERRPVRLLPGVQITGDPVVAGGTTEYTVSVDDNTTVTLTAPQSLSRSGTVFYSLVRWKLNGVDRPVGTALSFPINGDATAVVRYCPTHHTSDYRPATGTPGPGNRQADFVIDFRELLRAIQLYNLGAIHTDDLSEDGYAPGAGAHGWPHSLDYWPLGAPDWTIDFHELLRLIQFYNLGGYHLDPSDPPTTEDGFVPGLGAPGPAQVISKNVTAATVGVSGARSVPGNQYAPGGRVTISVRVEHAGDLAALGVVENVPAGWTLVSVSGEDAPTIQPAVGAAGPLAFAWTTSPASPVDFTYVLAVPASATGQKAISGTVLYRKGGAEQQAPLPDTVLAPAAPANRPPVADAGRDCTAKVGQTVHLSGQGSQDPDGRIVLYEWDLDGDGKYEMAGNRVTQVYDRVGIYTATLRVTDNAGATGTDACVITVTEKPGKGSGR
jgi:hypothetical protein